MNLTFLIPNLLGTFEQSTTEDLPRFAAIEELLSRAKIRRYPACSRYQTLCKLFNLEKPQSGDLPIASLSRLIDGVERPEGVWMRADPVHLITGRENLILANPDTLVLSQHDAIILAAAIEELLQDLGWQFELPVSKRWYVRLPVKPLITTTEIDIVTGREIQQFVPAGNDRREWHRIMNEIQILLYQSEVNHERAKQGQLPVNSLWFWGIGELPEILPRKWSHIYSDDPVAQGLAMISGARHSELPSSLGEIINNDGSATEILITSNSVQPITSDKDYYNWLESLQLLEQNWFKPAVQAIRDDLLHEVNIYTDGYQFGFNKNSYLRFWRRKKSIISYQ